MFNSRRYGSRRRWQLQYSCAMSSHDKSFNSSDFKVIREIRSCLFAKLLHTRNVSNSNNSLALYWQQKYNRRTVGPCWCGFPPSICDRTDGVIPKMPTAGYRQSVLHCALVCSALYIKSNITARGGRSAFSGVPPILQYDPQQIYEGQ